MFSPRCSILSLSCRPLTNPLSPTLPSPHVMATPPPLHLPRQPSYMLFTRSPFSLLYRVPSPPPLFPSAFIFPRSLRFVPPRSSCQPLCFPSIPSLPCCLPSILTYRYTSPLNFPSVLFSNAVLYSPHASPLRPYSTPSHQPFSPLLSPSLSPLVIYKFFD